MPTITVSPQELRETARFLRTLLDERKTMHQSLWRQMELTASMLPSDLRGSHHYANNPWNEAVETTFANYYQLALNMEAAADAYERGDHNVEVSFTFPN
jgi:uncharacterized protein YukE